ncbi:MAG: LuxR C-terminal-related transcriptional regulator [Pseudomonadota bacterium]
MSSIPPKRLPPHLPAAEGVFPTELVRYLSELNDIETGKDVFRLLLRLGEDVGLPLVGYGAVVRDEDVESALILHTNLPTEWFEWSRSYPEFSRVDYASQHLRHRLTPCVMGIEYEDCFEEADPRYAAIPRKAAEFGWRAGVVFPVRSLTPPWHGGVGFGGDISRAECDEIIGKHLCALHVVSLQAHQRLMALKLSELRDRPALTAKLRDVLEQLAEGRGVKQIAYDLGVAERTVENRIQRIKEKLGVRSRDQAVAKAAQLGIIEPPNILAPSEDD